MAEYKKDTPIEEESDDLLSRTRFCSMLSKSLLEYHDPASLVIGLLGSWGSGKTSLLNIVISNIQESSCDERPVVLRFNPWNFTSVDQLLQQYFRMLADVLTGSRDKKLSDIGSLMSDYGDSLDAIPHVGKAFGRGAGFFGRYIKQHTLHGADISRQRNELIKKLQEQKRKIIIAIDDIDRLTNGEIQLIFKLVSSVSNFPNTIFLLSFDKSIVQNALKDFQGDEGAAYLEKIIHVEISVPPISQEQKRKVFSYFFSPLLEKKSSLFPNMVFDQEYWYQISDHVFGMIDNIRDIKRLYNALLIKVNMIGDEVNFADLVMITLLEIKHRQFYSWMKDHQFELTSPQAYHSAQVTGNQTAAQKIHAKFLEEFIQFEPGISPKECDEILSIMFPVYRKASMYFLPDKSDLIRKQRIGHQDKFSRYFMLSLDDNQIPRCIVRYAVASSSAADIIDLMKKSAEMHSSDDLIAEVKALAGDLNKERKEVLLKAFIPGIKSLPDLQPSELLIGSAKNRACDFCIDMMNDIGTEISYSVMKEAIENAEPGDLEALSYILDIMLISHNRIRQNAGYPVVVTEKQLDYLGELYTKKIFELDKSNNILLLPHSLPYSIIKFFGKETELKSFIQTKLADSDYNKLLYLSQTMESRSGTNGVYFADTSTKCRQKFISDSDIMKAVTNAVKSGLINQLDEFQAYRVAAFFLYHTTNLRDKEIGVSKDDCTRKLQEWGYSSLHRSSSGND